MVAKWTLEVELLVGERGATWVLLVAASHERRRERHCGRVGQSPGVVVVLALRPKVVGASCRRRRRRRRIRRRSSEAKHGRAGGCCGGRSGSSSGGGGRVMVLVVLVVAVQVEAARVCHSLLFALRLQEALLFGSPILKPNLHLSFSQIQVA